MLKIAVFILYLLSGHCFKMKDPETLSAIECSLRTSGLAWSRLTPALTIDMHECLSSLNKTKMI